jgi:hypothetical protein
MSRPFQPSPGYQLFLLRLVQARVDRGFTREELADALGLTPEQVRAYEAGEVQLDFAETRVWCLVWMCPSPSSFSNSSRDMDDKLTGTSASAPTSRRVPTPRRRSHASSTEFDPEVPTIQVLFFPGPDVLPQVRRIPNTLEAKQELIGGLITTFETGCGRHDRHCWR